MLWKIAAFPRCAHHAFLSHCAEDRDALVRPVYDGLTKRGVVPWLDQEDYYYGRDSRTALRDGLLESRHIVFFVTNAMLSTARGWCILELAFAELLELNFNAPGGRLANFILPLFLVAQSDTRLPRTVWQVVRDRGRFRPPDASATPVEWCQTEIEAFLRLEQRACGAVANLCRDEVLAKTVKGIPGLFDRVTKFHPKRLPLSS